MKRYAATIDLVADEAKISEYLAHHRAVWPEVVMSFRAVGVVDLRIWRFGTRMFYELEVVDTFDPSRDFARYASMHPSNPVWEHLMTAFQAPLDGRPAGEHWASMTPAFSLAEHAETLATGRGLRVDAHVHLWKYETPEFSWIPEGPVRRDFGPADLQPLLSARSLNGAIAVQARCSYEETDMLLTLAERHPFLFGVVGWADVSAPDLAARLDSYASRDRLVGFREILQGRDAGAFLNENFLRGLRLLGERDYAYDILVYEDQLEAVSLMMASTLPGQRLVLDHLAKPRIRDGSFREWATSLRRLAQAYPNLHCKLSGMVTEARSEWSASDLRPYMETVLEAFGDERVMYGSDWPVALTAASDYGAVYDVAHTFVRELGPDSERRIFGENAVRFYKIPSPKLS